MKTINLTIENLVKTELFKQFDEDQKEEIILGANKGLDVSIYAKPEFAWAQMNEIRLGLEGGLNVNRYAKPVFNWQEMHSIRRQLQNENN